MLSDYIKAAMQRAHYEILSDDGTYYGSIPGLDGVWANASTLDGCERELAEVVEDWVLVRKVATLAIPVLDNIDLNVREGV